MVTVYEAAGGSDGMLRLAHAWHERVMADEVVSHAFQGGTEPDHGERLATYWGEALGGPPDYSTRYGDESHVVRLHSGKGAHEDMDRRAIECFDAALVDTGLALTSKTPRKFFDHTVVVPDFGWEQTQPDDERGDRLDSRQRPKGS